MGKLIDLNGLGHFKDKENEMIAADYSATKTYAVGDYVYYNGVLKRCITAITTAEAYTAAHWANAVLAGDVTELKTALTQIFTKWEQGTINYSTGEEESSNSACRTIGFFEPSEDVIVTITNPNTQTLGLRIYNGDGSYASSPNITTFNSFGLYYGKKYRLVCASTGVPSSVSVKIEIPNKNGFPFVNEKLDSIYQTNTPFDTPTITNGKFVIGTGSYIGQLNNNADSAYTDYIPVNPNSVIQVSGCFLSDTRGICGYDSTKTVVSPALATGTYSTIVKITIPDNVHYIRITARKDTTPTLKYVSYEPIYEEEIKELDSRIDDINANYGDRTTNIPVTIQYEERYISYLNENNADAGSCYTNFVPVIPGRTYTFNNIYIYNNRAICKYNQAKEFIEALAYNSNATSLTATIPADTYYVKITGRVNVSPVVLLHDPTYYDIVDWYEKSHILISRNSRASVINKKIVTLIDDDGDNETAMTGLADLCDSLGMRCTFAVIANQIDSNQSHREYIKALQNDGFHIANHTYSHSRWYGDYGGETMFTLQECEEDLLKAMDVFETHNFIDASKYFVYTGDSASRQGVPAIIKKWCEVGATTWTGFAEPDTSSRILLNRTNITPELNFDFYKNQIDNHTGDNIWLIYYTHCKMTEQGKYDATLTENVLQYAITNGYTPMTYNEAWNYRKAQFTLQEMFGF